MQPDLKTPGDRFEFLLLELGYNDVQMAEILEVTSVSVGRWRQLKKMTDRTKRNMYNLVKKLNISLDWIETGEGTPFLISTTDTAAPNSTTELKKLQQQIATQQEDIRLLQLKNQRLEEIIELNAKLIDQLRELNKHLEQQLTAFKQPEE